jgi:CheY-like chemotaxis protein
LAGHEVEVAGDGGPAVERSRRRQFDLVFLDVPLARIDRIITPALLRPTGSTRDLPVAMLTNNGDERLRRRAHPQGIPASFKTSDRHPWRRRRTDRSRRAPATALERASTQAVLLPILSATRNSLLRVK